MLEKGAVNRLIEAAKHAWATAYAPYSKFKVGAAVLAKDGSIFAGANVENASFGLTCCAERVAIFKAVTEGRGPITAVAVYAESDEPISPCGACRQVIFEFGRNVEVIGVTPSGARTHWRIEELLPAAFGPDALE